ncbi:MAG: sigma-E processing peptidase SpoIIGA [Erysipelotrichaceae bacterium]|nr:sigma-E processing peptidase SpoIIGA [Erysipelotrichaceae bacterium]
MSSYLEWVYLFQMILLWSISILISFLFNRYISYKRCIIYSILYPFFAVFFFEYWNLLILILFDFLCLKLLISSIPMILCQVWLRYLINYSMMLIFKGTVYHGIWFMEKDSYAWIFVAFSIWFLAFYCKKHISNRQLIEFSYSITIHFSNQKIRCLAYWDSGNFANMLGTPILFLNNEQLLEKLNQSVLKCNIQNQEVSLIQGEIYGMHIPRQDVYLTYLKQPVQGIYPCLLNQLLERGNL